MPQTSGRKGNKQYNLVFSEGELEMQSRELQEKKVQRPAWRAFGFLGDVGISIIIPILVCMGIGMYVDKHYALYPKGVLGGLGIGFLLSFVALYQAVRRFIRET